MPFELDESHAETGRRSRFLWILILVICAIKLALYIADPGVKVVLGDSGSYLASAISQYVPADRSYTYGLFLRALLHVWYSLKFIVMIQVGLSAGAAILLAWVSYRVLRLSAFVTAVCSVLCALDPLQLLSERYIMTETISTFLFAIVMCLGFRYLFRPRLRDLLLVAVCGMLLVSFRVYFLPAVLLVSVLTPLATGIGQAGWRELRSLLFGKKPGSIRWLPDQKLFDFGLAARLAGGRFRFHLRRDFHWPPQIQNLGRMAVHLTIAVLSVQFALWSLRTWYGHEVGGPAAYIEQDGLFLLTDVSTLVQESDFRNRELGHLVFSNVRVPQHEKQSRVWNHWGDAGLINVLIREVPVVYPGSGPWEINKIAKRTALRTIERHPVGVVRLMLSNLRDYFTVSELERALIVNEFVDQGITPNYQELFRRLGWNATWQGRSGVVREWHQRSVYWCLYLASCPFLATAALLVPGMPRKGCLLFGVVCAWPLWGVSTLLPEELAPRYFTGLAWLLILLTGLVLQGVIDLVRKRRSTAETTRKTAVLA